MIIISLGTQPNGQLLLYPANIRALEWMELNKDSFTLSAHYVLSKHVHKLVTRRLQLEVARDLQEELVRAFGGEFQVFV